MGTPKRTLGALVVILATMQIGVGNAGGEAGADGGPASPAREPRAGAVALTAAPPQTVELTLPFDGIWGVLQGMDSDSTHVGYAAYALDFVPAERLNPPGLHPAPPRTRLEDFPCYGRAVLAAAAGVVVWAQDGAADEAPHGADGTGLEAEPPRKPGPSASRRPRRKPKDSGNYVIVRHAEAEYTEYRHLQNHSIAVGVGERVRRSQVLGRCGNSGNAGTPHLHVGLLGSVFPIATRPMRFSRYQVLTQDGRWMIGKGVPESRQILRSLVSSTAGVPGG